MPYKSEKQRKWIYANKPDIAARWDKEGKNYIKGKKISLEERIKRATSKK